MAQNLNLCKLCLVFIKRSVQYLKIYEVYSVSLTGAQEAKRIITVGYSPNPNVTYDEPTKSKTAC
jgi:hypothetical protein